MKKVTKSALGTLVVASILALVTVFTPVAPTALAACDINEGIAGGKDCTDSPTTPNSLFDSDGVFVTIVNILLFVIGAISVIMLIIGGIRYTVSGGDSGNVTAAKNTIMYALIGLVVAFLAFAIVNFVLTSLTPGA